LIWQLRQYRVIINSIDFPELYVSTEFKGFEKINYLSSDRQLVELVTVCMLINSIQLNNFRDIIGARFVMVAIHPVVREIVNNEVKIATPAAWAALVARAQAANGLPSPLF
jgi:hypothetical protein